jgi:hypothetical protein
MFFDKRFAVISLIIAVVKGLEDFCWTGGRTEPFRQQGRPGRLPRLPRLLLLLVLIWIS